jgi:hypothetical protein
MDFSVKTRSASSKATKGAAVRGILGLFTVLLLAPVGNATPINCSNAYGGKEAICERVACDEKYLSFLGTWSGPFESYIRELSTFRPYHNTITYAENDCLKNIYTGETFIIGRRTDFYPAFQDLAQKEMSGLMITGKKEDGTPFLRTVDEENGLLEYKLDHKDEAKNLSVWTLAMSATKESPEMKFTITDGQDFTEPSIHTRNVSVNLSIGPSNGPYWEGLIIKGYHSLNVQRE